jgi:hypothetical protein
MVMDNCVMAITALSNCNNSGCKAAEATKMSIRNALIPFLNLKKKSKF